MAVRTVLPVVSYDRQRIAEDIAARGWSVRDAARVAGIGYRTLYRFLGGECVPATKTVASITKALGTIPETYIQRSQAVA